MRAIGGTMKVLDKELTELQSDLQAVSVSSVSTIVKFFCLTESDQYLWECEQRNGKHENLFHQP
jgi:hypothetical protein